MEDQKEDQNEQSNNWRSLSKLDLIVLGISFGAGIGFRLTDMEGYSGTVDYLTDGLPVAIMTGFARSIYGGIKDGLRRGSIVYGGYLAGQTFMDCTLNQF
jgi:hypothetical protein